MSQRAEAQQECWREEKPREIHFWAFPKQFYIQLTPEVTKNLVNRAAEKMGGIRTLASVLPISTGVVYQYRKQGHFIPLGVVLKMSELVSDELVKEHLEAHVTAYKGTYNAKPILHPNLPLKETPELFEFMGHMTGDGGHTAKTAYYDNTNEVLRSRVRTLLRGVFGEVPINMVLMNRPSQSLELKRISFGLTVVRLLGHLYGVNFRTHTTRVPKRLFELPQKFVAAYLRGFGDGEGSVQDDRVELHSSNAKLMKDLDTLVRMKFPEMGEFTGVFDYPNRKGWKYTLKFRAGALEGYQTLIGFIHPVKKEELDRVLARRERGWHHRTIGITRRLILDALREGPLPVKGLIHWLEVGGSSLRRHLKGLMTLGAVIQTPEGGYSPDYEITEVGRKLLELPPMVLERNAKTELNILKALMAEGLLVEELVHQIGRSREVVYHNLIGVKSRGRPGLLKLGLVRRIGRGTKTIPYVYHLTNEGRRVVEAVEQLFPNYLEEE